METHGGQVSPKKKTASSIRIRGCWPVFCAPLSPERRGRPMNGTLSPPTVSEVAPKPSSKNLYDGHERTQAQPLKNIPVSPSGTVCWLTMRERHRSREPLQRLEGAFRPPSIGGSPSIQCPGGSPDSSRSRSPLPRTSFACQPPPSSGRQNRSVECAWIAEKPLSGREYLRRLMEHHLHDSGLQM